jgi:hypothetical protein
MSAKFTDQQIKAASSALNAYKEKPFVKHQWEELVFRLSHDSDPCMRERMYHEMDIILEKDPGFRVFKMH